MTEPLEVLNPYGLPTGEVKPRDQVHRDGDLHRTLHLWLLSGANVVLQRRAHTKDIEPGKVDVAVGGHFGVGETLRDVLREAEEELGLTVSVGQLEYLGTFQTLRRYPGVTDHELQETYLLRRELPLERYVLDPGEVEVVYEVPFLGALALFEDGTPLAAAGYDAYGRQNNALLVTDDLIDQARGDATARLRQIQSLLGETPSPR